MNVFLLLLVLTTPTTCGSHSLTYPALRSASRAWRSSYSVWSTTEDDSDSYSSPPSETDSYLYLPPPADFDSYSSPPADSHLYSSSPANSHPALTLKIATTSPPLTMHPQLQVEHSCIHTKIHIITLTCACTNTQLTNGHSITNTMQLTCMYM